MIKKKLQHIRIRREWRKRNPHNSTIAKNIFNLDCVGVGKKTYGELTVYTHNEVAKLRIGSFCSIGPNVQFVLSADHRMDTISTFPFKVKFSGDSYEGISKGDIVLEDDVWIGASAIILSGVYIGQGAVVAAGALVNKDVEPYTIVGGVPIKTIRKKFSEKIIQELLKIDFQKVSDSHIKDNIDALYTTLTDENYKEIISMIRGNIE